MKKSKLNHEVESLKTETKEALQLVIDELNHGQKQKITKNEAVKTLLNRYGVEY